MPVELSDLLSNRRWVGVDVMGHTIQVAYRPGATSLKRQAQLEREMRQLQKADEMDEEEVILRTGKVFCEIVCDWDLTRNGHPIPLSPEEVIDLPGMVINSIMQAVQADGQRSADEKKLSSVTSGVGSTPKGNLAPAQNGIPSSEARGTWA
jgi:hypothetical protein